MKDIQHIHLHWGDEEAEQIQRSRIFHFTPLGFHICTRRQVDLFKVFHFNLKADDAKGAEVDVSCSGVVVHLEPDDHPGYHRIWVKLIDLSEACFLKIERITGAHCQEAAWG